MSRIAVGEPAPNVGVCGAVGADHPRLADSTCAGCSQPLSQFAHTLKSSPPVTMSFFKSVRGKAGRFMDRLRSLSPVQRSRPSSPQLPPPPPPQDEPSNIRYRAAEQRTELDSAAVFEQLAEADATEAASSSTPVALLVTTPSHPPSPAPPDSALVSALALTSVSDLALDEPPTPSAVIPMPLGLVVRDFAQPPRSKYNTVSRQSTTAAVMSTARQEVS